MVWVPSTGAFITPPDPRHAGPDLSGLIPGGSFNVGGMLYDVPSEPSATLPGSVSRTRILRGELPDRWTRLRGRS